MFLINIVSHFILDIYVVLKKIRFSTPSDTIAKECGRSYKLYEPKLELFTSNL